MHNPSKVGQGRTGHKQQTMTDEGKGKRFLCNHTGFELAIVKSNPRFKMKFFSVGRVSPYAFSPYQFFCVYVCVCVCMCVCGCLLPLALSPDSFDCRQRDSSLGIERVHFTSVCVCFVDARVE